MTISEAKETLSGLMSAILSQSNPINRLILGLQHEVRLEEDFIAAANATTILYGAGYFQLPRKEMFGVMLHEVLHVALQHSLRFSHLHPTIANIAMDLIINDIVETELPDKVLFALPKEGCFFRNEPYCKALKVKRKEEWETEELYYWLLESLPEAKSGQNSISVDQSYFPSGSKHIKEKNNKEDIKLKAPYIPRDVLSADSNELNEQQRLEISHQMDRLINDMRAGTDSAGIVRRLEKAKGKPRIPWRSLLRQYLLSGIAKRTQHNYSRPNNVFLANVGPYEPSTVVKKQIKAIAVLIDTSGSVFYGQCLEEVLKIIDGIRAQIPTKLYLVHTDTEVTHIQTIKDSETFNKHYDGFKGGGGTCFNNAIDAINSLKPTLIIAVTDGYTNSWGKTKIPTYWVMLSNVKAPYGKTLPYTT